MLPSLFKSRKLPVPHCEHLHPHQHKPVLAAALAAFPQRRSSQCTRGVPAVKPGKGVEQRSVQHAHGGQEGWALTGHAALSRLGLGN